MKIGQRCEAIKNNICVVAFAAFPLLIPLLSLEKFPKWAIIPENAKKDQAMQIEASLEMA